MVIINGDDSIGVEQIAKVFDLSAKTIYRDLKAMNIQWEGASKTGHWVIGNLVSKNGNACAHSLTDG